jgi:hypothetical protein
VQRALAGLLPPALVVLHAGWCGNLLGSVTAAGSAVAVLTLLGLAAWFAGSWSDPLRLGRRGVVLPILLWGAVAASAWRSPVPRAALATVVLLPAHLLLPGALCRCWRSADARRWAARGMAMAVGGLAAWALAGAGESGQAGLAALPAATPAGAPPASLPGLAATLAPLGHHTLLATWLATLLPLALLPLRDRVGWRWLGAVAGGLALAAILAGRSLAGGAALACEALAAAVVIGLWPASPPAGGAAVGGSAGPSSPPAPELPRPGPRGRRRLAGVLALAGLLLAVTQAGRLVQIAGRNDSSAQARSGYIRAGWQGWRERPWLGWGPGSAAWTAGWFLAPRPGLNPWGEAVGELHSLPVHLAYETGAVGLAAALALAGAFLRRRRAELAAAPDPAWLAAGCLGLAGAAVAWLGTAALAVPAMPLSLAVAAGAALAGGGGDAAGGGAGGAGGGDRGGDGAGGGGGDGGSGQPPGSSGGAGRRHGFSLAAGVYALLAAVALAAPEAARWHYDRAVDESQHGRPGRAAVELAAAVRLDPDFPLYRLRLALLASGSGGSGSTGGSGSATGSDGYAGSGGSGGGAASGGGAGLPLAGEAAALALRAARDARGVGLLWLVAGILGRADGEVWATAALEQGCALDPLSPYPPFYLMASLPEGSAAARLGARALLAEPRLAAATFWEGREPLFQAALDAAAGWPGVERGWQVALRQAAPAAAARHGRIRRLGLAIDTAGFTQSTSLHLFRRRPWPTVWPLVAVRESLLPALGMPPATSLPANGGMKLAGTLCGPQS